MIKIPMVDLRRSHERFRTEIEEAVLACMQTTQFILGPEVSRFEERFCEYLHQGNGRVVSCGNGTDALLLTLLAMDFPAGSEVIVPDFTFVATAETVVRAGLTPVFVDVDEQTFCIRPDAIEAAVTDRTVAVIPVHLFGLTAPMEAILDIARKHRLKVIEDTAQATGSTFRFSDGTTRKAGTMGDAGCFSFFPSKNLGGYGDGGAVFTTDETLADRIRSLRNHGQYQRYYYKEIGTNSRLDSIQAAVLNVKLTRLDQFNQERRTAAAHYIRLLQDVAEVTVPAVPDYTDHVFHQFTIQVPPERRDALISHLSTAGVAAQIYYPMRLSAHAPYQSFPRGDVAVTARLNRTVLSLPMFPELTTDEIQYITSTIKSFFK